MGTCASRARKPPEDNPDLENPSEDFVPLRERRPKRTKRGPRHQRIERYLQSASSDAAEKNPGLASCLACVAPAARAPVHFLCLLTPLLNLLLALAHGVYNAAPKNLLQALFGGCLCLYGGTYVASLAAIEAFCKMGGERVLAELRDVWAQAHASGADDAVEPAADEEEEEQATCAGLDGCVDTFGDDADKLWLHHARTLTT